MLEADTIIFYLMAVCWAEVNASDVIYTGVEIKISKLLAHRTSVIKILLARPNFHWPAYKKKLEAQGPCTGHRSIIAILYCFSLKYMIREKGRDLTQYTNLCGLNTLPH